MSNAVVIDTKQNNGCEFKETRTIWCVLNRNKIITIIAIHYDEFSINIYEMNYFSAIITASVPVIKMRMH